MRRHKQAENRVMNIMNTSKVMNGYLVIKERDKYLATRHKEDMLAQSGCEDILVKSTAKGTAYAYVTKDTAPKYPLRAYKGRQKPPAGEMDCYAVEHNKGVLQSINDDYVIIQENQVINISRIQR